MLYNGDMKTTCEFASCENSVKGLRLCENHLKKYRRGTLDTTGLSLTPRKATSDEDRWEKYVNKSGDCWLWTGSKSGPGYGTIRIEGALMPAHRWTYEQIVGPIPDGMDLDHTCHNNDETCPGGDSCWHRACVNPSHLEPKTRASNLSAGNGPGGAKWTPKTECVNGHDLSDPSNLAKPDKHGRRVCRPCDNIRGQEYRARQKAKAQS